MPFHFSLAAVLMMREIIERRELNALERIHAEIIRTEADIARNRELLRIAEQNRESELGRGVAAVQLEACYEQERVLEEQHHTQQARLSELKVLQRRQLEIYQAARRKREVLEDIRTRQLNEYHRDQLKREQKTLDEIFLARHKRAE